MILCFVYALYEFTWIRIVGLKGSDFTSKVNNKRLVFLSDLQFDHPLFGFYHRAAKKMIKHVLDLNPDFIIFGGDFIHKDSKHAYQIFDYLAQFDVPMFAVMGNHDYRNIERVLSECERIGIRVLRDEVIDWEGITLVGIDQTWKKTRDEFKFNRGDYTIVISHSPDYLVRHKVQGDVLLSGHLHGGQITFFGLYAPVPHSAYRQKYLHGLKSIEASKIYISSGLGGFVFCFPIRFFSRPEIVLIDLE